MINEHGETYLGDGLYALDEGWQVRLRAPRLEGHDCMVYLDANVLAHFKAWLAAREAKRSA